MIKVLIVEDEMITALALKNKLKQNGFEVCTLASSGPKAVQVAEEENPDIVLMDIRLKGEMGGIETADEILVKFNIPSIFMSGYNETYVKNLLKDNAGYRFLIKPIETNSMLTMIETVLNTDNG